MIIHFLTMDGSPLGVTMKTLYGEDGIIGCGGSEYLMLTLCEEWANAGHEVVLFNNPREFGVSPFEQRNISDFNPNDKRDVLINFRSANPRTVATTNCLKVWLSTDQLSTGDYAAFSHHVDKIVGISPRHAQFFNQYYGIQNMIVIDIPIRTQDFDQMKDVVKIKNRLIFTSVPARGLDNLWRIYPLIQKEIPDVSVAITSDYRLWGVGASNEHFRVKWMNRSNVLFFGALPRRKYVEELMKSQITLYPCNYDELFCVAIAEAQYAGAYPITSNAGALPTTNMGAVLPLDANDRSNDKTYADAVIAMLEHPDELLAVRQKEVHKKAKERFDPKRIMLEWDDLVFSKG